MNIEEQVLSREQMAHLKELGINTSDASMMWVCCKGAQKERWYLQINNELSRGVANVMNRAADFFVPTYTIGDLIEKLPKEIQHNGIWYYLQISYLYRVVMYRNRYTEHEYDELLYSYIPGEDLLSSLFRILCCVAENYKELIK